MKLVLVFHLVLTQFSLKGFDMLRYYLLAAIYVSIIKLDSFEIVNFL
jgi:hypothetical protein